MLHHPLKLLSFCIITALSTNASAQPVDIVSTDTTEHSTAEIIEVRGVRQKLAQDGRLKDVIQKTEMIDQAMINNKNATSLSEAIQDEPGIRVSNECSMCGVKRVMLNGMKGEHTTILVDGLPTHTLISGFYAVDAIATSGIDRIEIARGAGASLIAPEAIGGTINIITKEAYSNSLSLDIARGYHNYSALQSVATAVSDSGDTGITLIAQYDGQDQEDHDANGISEAPLIRNQSVTSMISHDLNAKNNLRLRYSRVQSEVFGGPVIGNTTDSIGTALASFDDIASESLFIDDDVRKGYIGKAWEMTEWIKTDREEAYLQLLSSYSSKLTAEYSVSYARHWQDSFYEGVDYQADDNMRYLRAKFDYLWADAHFFTFGIDSRQEKMRSNSQALNQNPSYATDAFNYTTYGAFIQHTYQHHATWELAMAVRADHIRADFIDPSKPGIEINNWIISPRLDLRYFHNPQITSRFSAGRGYRAPLSFFETDHGILDTGLGYQIDISEPERSLSASYSLNYDNQTLSTTASISYSAVSHLASLAETDEGIPLLTQLNKKAHVTTFDWVAGVHLSENLLINVSFERFIYDAQFRRSYAIAPVENRAGIELEWQHRQWQLNLSNVWFGRRNLIKYGYEGFNIAADDSSIKPIRAKAHSVSNLKLGYQLTAKTNLYVGVSNLFDYTQTNQGDSPLFFDAQGNLDVGYIYAPLHGRELYAGIHFAL